MRSYFVDTWAYLALLNRRDAGHDVAREADAWLDENGWMPVTSDWILDETVTQLHALAGPQVATRFLDDLDVQLRARTLLIVSIGKHRMEAATQWFRRLAPKVPRLSLTDTCTFGVMEELELRWAFTADRHFFSAGPKIGPLITRDGPHLHFRAPE